MRSSPRPMQRDEHSLGQRPAKPRRRQAEGGGRRHDQDFFDRNVGCEQRTDAKPKRIARGQHAHLRSRAAPAFRGSRRRTVSASASLASMQRRASAQMARAADDEIGARERARARSARSAVGPVFADADDGQPGSHVVGFRMTYVHRASRMLILGGTAEARRLADALAGRPEVAVTLSLAGRTAEPLSQPVPVRRGGFGGAEGLAEYLRAERIDLLIDATHPYADAISANAARAAELAGVKLLAIRRPPWRRVDGDNWIEVADAEEAARALGEAPRRVFLALGRNELDPFATCPQHFYLVRSVDPVDAPLAVPHASYITALDRFGQAEDRGRCRGSHRHRDLW